MAQTRSAKAGLQFQVGRIYCLLKRGNSAQRVGAVNCSPASPAESSYGRTSHMRNHHVWCLTMVEPSKCPVSSKRHAQLISSLSRLSKKHSKHDLNFTERAAHSLVQARNARRDETISSSTTQKDVASVSVVRKLTISRRHISLSISPPATPRIHQKDGSEKENVEVRNDASLKQTIGRSVSAASLRRAPVPLVNARSLRPRKSQLISGSTNSDIIRLPRGY
ncbi:hypothetical protein ACEPAI_3303 [Sanghuangporus weigelae]